MMYRTTAYLFMASVLWLAACAEPQTPDETPAPAAPSITTETVTYTVGDMTFQGYLAYDANRTELRPGVLVVHEWWGHNDYARRRARMLAELGYTALALDMYGDGKTADHPDDAMAFSQAVASNMDAAQQRFEAAYTLLQNHPTTDPERMAAIGYCFGGGIVLEMARRGVDLDAVASFHGGVLADAPIEPGVVQARLLIQEGADDPFVTAEQIEQFKQHLDAAGVAYEIFTYPGAKHSFTNPTADSLGARFNMPIAYNAEADRQSWERMQALFDEVW